MNVLLESPLAVGAIGAVLVTVAAIFFSQTRSRAALASVVLALLLAVGGVVLERAIETPREQVLATIGDLFAAIRSNDLPGLLRLIDPAATEMRSDAETLMPLFKIDSAGEGGEVRVDLPTDPTSDGAIASARLKPLIKVQHTQSGATGMYFDQLELELVRRGEAWRFSGYAPEKDWREGAAQLGR